MAKSYKFEDRVQIPLGRVEEILTDPQMREEEATKIAGALEASCQVEERGDVKRMVVHQKEHGYSVDGKRDTSKVEDVTLTIDWDTRKHACRWQWRMASQGERVRIDGSTTLRQDDDATLVIETGDVDVKVPVVGRVAEGKIVKGIQKERPSWVKWLRDKA